MGDEKDIKGLFNQQRNDFPVVTRVISGCDDCVADHRGICLLAEAKNLWRKIDRDDDKAAPDWCPLRKGPIRLKLEPDE